VIPTIGWMCLDARNPEILADWWSRLLGGGVKRTDQDGDVHLDVGAISLLFLKVSEPKRSKNRMHLDLRVVDYEPSLAPFLWGPRRRPISTAVMIGRSFGIPKEMSSASSDRNMKHVSLRCSARRAAFWNGTIDRWCGKRGIAEDGQRVSRHHAH
jgi:hypothetical protein